jgi:hypothetical protein
MHLIRNQAYSQGYRGFESLSLRNARPGEVTEWPKVHDWKSCVLKGTVGSNPTLSANALSIFDRDWSRVYGPG